MRLFIAIPLEREIKDHLAKIRLPARMVRDFHLTLKFLGEVPAAEVSKITASLDDIDFAGFRFSLSGIGFFPDEKKARVVWVGVEPADDIIRLQKQVDESLATLGFSREKSFHPHITLARAKNPKYNDALISSASNIKILAMEIPVNGFELIKSTLTPEGPAYEALKTFINKSKTLE